LKKPVEADVDSSSVFPLTGDLSRLEAVEFIADRPKAGDLEKLYGLGKTAVTARITFTDAKKNPPRTELFAKQPAGKPEYYAKLADSPAVFVVRKELHDALEKSSLSYRPLQLWQMLPDQVAELRIQKDGKVYRLKRDEQKWRITGPFTVRADSTLVQ